MKILVINPNSTGSMTAALKAEIDTLLLPASIEIEYYTASDSSFPPAPPSINNQDDAVVSSDAVLADLKEKWPDHLTGFDGYLIACYSDHPLVYELNKHVSKGSVVMGIFQASMIYALQYGTPNNKAAILTSNSEWKCILDRAISKFCGHDNNTFPHDKFVQTHAVGVPVLELHDTNTYPIIKRKVEFLIDLRVNIILLGCAGLSCWAKQLSQDFVDVKFVDSVVIGVELLISFINIQKR